MHGQGPFVQQSRKNCPLGVAIYILLKHANYFSILDCSIIQKRLSFQSLQLQAQIEKLSLQQWQHGEEQIEKFFQQLVPVWIKGWHCSADGFKSATPVWFRERVKVRVRLSGNMGDFRILPNMKRK